MMLKLLLPLAIMAVTVTARASEDVTIKAPALKPFHNNIEQIPMAALKMMVEEQHICAIPLKELHVGNAKELDPIALPPPPVIIDKIAHPVPIKACRP